MPSNVPETSGPVYDLASAPYEQPGPVYDLASAPTVIKNGAEYDLAAPSHVPQSGESEHFSLPKSKQAWGELDESSMHGFSHGYDTISMGSIDRTSTLPRGFAEEEA